MDGEETSWEPLVSSNCRTGRELVLSPEGDNREMQILGQLEKEVPDILATEGMGQGSVDGSTRKRISSAPPS